MGLPLRPSTKFATARSMMAFLASTVDVPTCGVRVTLGILVNSWFGVRGSGVMASRPAEQISPFYKIIGSRAGVMI